MRGFPTIKWCLWLTAVVFLTVSASAGELASVEPAKDDKCPVCGMFVAKYPDWTAQIVYSGTDRLFFDGAKDLFKYYLDPSAYGGDRSGDKVQRIYVTEYYDLKPIDARNAFFVIGGDVYGPMGHELIPFSTIEGAKVFLRDHHGKRILRFDAITPEVIKPLQ